MNEWHVSDPALRAWIDGTASVAESASVEQHLISCARCRAAVAPAAMTAPSAGGPPALPDLDATWVAIRDSVEAQPLNRLGRVLHRAGLSEPDALLLSSTPALTGAWLTGVGMVALFTWAATGFSSGRGLALVLCLAPLLPVAGVAVAFGAEDDPTRELTLAAPYSKLRLLLLRTAVVLLTCVPLVVLATIPFEGPWWASVIWLVPAAAFVSLTLAAATYAPPVYAAAGIAIGWFAFTAPAVLQRDVGHLTSQTSLFGYITLGIVGLVVFAARSHRLATDWRIG
jgi:hypothetical protein